MNPKKLLSAARRAMYDFDEVKVRSVLDSLSAPDATFRLCFPFGDSIGAEAFYDKAYADLFKAWPDLERRDFIVVEGEDSFGEEWVGCAGHYCGTFLDSWLDIPPTGHQACMRFHEFFRFQNGKIMEFQGIWDIPEVMMQAKAWPMTPSLGREWRTPAPATQDGLLEGKRDKEKSKNSLKIVIEMLEALNKHPAQGGPKIMQMEKFWHQRMNWYGPAGIGSCGGIQGFRHWHQIPFLNAMPDRKLQTDDVIHHFFSENDYVAVTGWPNMIQTLTNDGWMGIAPAGKKVELRSLDFWRIEGDKIRENWVLVDLLDLYAQLGVDVFARLREFNKARNTGRIEIPDAMDS